MSVEKGVLCCGNSALLGWPLATHRFDRALVSARPRETHEAAALHERDWSRGNHGPAARERGAEEGFDPAVGDRGPLSRKGTSHSVPFPIRLPESPPSPLCLSSPSFSL